MGLRVFYISSTGRRDIRKRQIHVFSVLSSWKFDFESIDVADPENEEHRDFVIESGKKTDDGKIMLPQIFKEDECCGDYLDFLQAIEHEKLQLFLKQMTQEEFDALQKNETEEPTDTTENAQKEDNEETDETDNKDDQDESDEKKDDEEVDEEKKDDQEDGEEKKDDEDEETKEETDEATAKGNLLSR